MPLLLMLMLQLRDWTRYKSSHFRMRDMSMHATLMATGKEGRKDFVAPVPCNGPVRRLSLFVKRRIVMSILRSFDADTTDTSTSGAGLVRGAFAQDNETQTHRRPIAGCHIVARGWVLPRRVLSDLLYSLSVPPSLSPPPLHSFLICLASRIF